MWQLRLIGGQGLAKKLDRLGRAEQGAFKRTAKRAVRARGKPILTSARSAAPVWTGRLRRAIKMKAWKTRDRWEFGVKIIIDHGQNRDDPRGAWYGAIVESGYVTGGRYVPGHHMLRNAYDRHGKAAAKGLHSDLRRIARQVIKGQ